MKTFKHPRVLVVFYSRTGATRNVAWAIAKRCHADLEEVRDVRSRKGPLGFLRSAVEAMRKTVPAIAPPSRQWADFDLIVIGTPVWGGHISSPVRAYLTQARLMAKPVAFFCTLGGRGAETAFAELSELTRTAPCATLALTAAQLAQGAQDARVDEFVAAFAKSEGPSTQAQPLKEVSAA